MNAMDITCQNPSSFARFVRRSVMLIVLLFAFAAGASAQRYYVMYYEIDGTRHYLAISEDGNSLTNETELSLRCYWVADGDFYTALDVDKDNRQTPSTPVNTYNEGSRKTLHSAKYPAKYLSQASGHVDNTQYAIKNNNVLTLRLIDTPTSPQRRWLMDNHEKNTPILYYYYYKHYIYYDNGWKYATDGHSKNFVKIESYSVFPPQISVAQDGGSYNVTMSAQDGCTIYYTTDGSEPTASSTNIYIGSFTPLKEVTIIKAIAYDPITKIASSVAEMILPQSLTVTLDDREGHGWTYYTGVDNNYNTSYAGKLYSPAPRDVMITYDGNGGAVSINEPETKFVYYKTLEQGNNEGEYPYTVISNPFSVRPSVVSANGTKTYYGFGGWKIISGGEYIKGYNDGDTLPLDAEIVFVNLTNDQLYQIRFEATWVEARITHLTSLTGTLNNETNKYANDYTYSKEGGTYETNFLVLNCNPTSITLESPCTIVMVEPDGSVDYRGTYTFTGSIVPYDNTLNNGNGNSKIEYTHWNPIANIDAKGRNFTIGRGMRMNGGIHLYGTNQLAPVNQILKVESGKFNQFRHYANDAETGYGENDIVKQWVTHGCDYDRAKGDNNKLEFTHRMYVGYKCSLNLSHDQEMCRVYGLSGRFMTQVNKGSADWEQCYYMSVSDAYNKGHRYMEIQGGEWLSITGGTDYYDPSSGLRNYENYKGTPSFTFRMRGGHVKGSIYGAAAFYDAAGTRTFVITGGTINGWIAGGANGTREYGGHLYGASYTYIGGKASVNSNGSSSIINRAIGGNVFGAGCGYSASSTSGQVTEGTNVVIADNAYVERGVYGGGSYGYCATNKTSNIYITGGTIGGVAGGVNETSYVSTIKGGVFGGACQNKGGNVNIYMTGGTVNGGLYGGSNESGTLNADAGVNIRITGGTVGTDSKEASVYGGGYGSGAAVSGNVDLRMTGGLIHGNIFGGGNAAAVEGNTSVTITGGEVKRNVYGGGNQAAVSGTTNVVIGQGT